MSELINFGEIILPEKETHIIVHNFPDPDAISSAMAIHYLINKILNKKIGNIYYSGEISHPQNKSMVTLLNANLIDYNEEPFEKGSNVILIDTNSLGEGSNQTAISLDDVNVIAVIDHHKGKHPKNAKIDYRPVGSTASIVWEYLVENGYDFTGDDGKTLATALVTGIFTDTASLMSENINELDFKAYQYLLHKVDKQKMKSIMNYPLPSYLFELRQKAFLESNQQIIESTIITGIGIIGSTKRDALPIIADELLRMNGISTSIVFAIIDNFIDISIRSNDITLDVSSFVQDVFDNGGGKQGAGRARIPLGFFSISNEKDSDLNSSIWELTKKIIFDKVKENLIGN